MVMGHEATGRVADAGQGVDRGLVGRRVVLQPFVYCGACPQCIAGTENLCARRHFHGVDRDGAMALALNVPAANVEAIPDTLADLGAVLVEPLAVALHAVSVAGAMAGRIVFVAGCGPIGLLTGFVARRAGARTVVGTDLQPRRRAAALALGFDAAAHPAETASLRAAAGASRPRFADVAFDAVGVEATLAQAVELLAPAGTLVALGGWQAARIDLRGIVGNELALRGSFNYRRDEFERAIAVVSETPTLGERIVTDAVPMDEGAAAFARLAAGTHTGLKIVLEPPG